MSLGFQHCVSLLNFYNTTELKWELQVYEYYSNLLQRRPLFIGSGFLPRHPIICDALRDLVAFAQLKKREKHQLY